jgi:integrase
MVPQTPNSRTGARYPRRPGTRWPTQGVELWVDGGSSAGIWQCKPGPSRWDVGDQRGDLRVPRLLRTWHADNGTPVDVLRQLMDHRSIQTTGGYYITTPPHRPNQSLLFDVKPKGTRTHPDLHQHIIIGLR